MLQLFKMKKQLKLVSVFGLLALLSQAFVGFSFAQEFPQAPNEVQNVVASPSNGQVLLSWDEAVDPDGVVNEYKVYYGKTSVKTATDSYEDEIIVGKVTSYTVTGLTNGVPYFFAVTAIDDEQSESLTYSVEVSATPVNPQATSSSEIKLLSIRQNWDNEIQMSMSGKVFFSADPLSAFIVYDKETGKNIVLKEVQVLDEQVVLVTSKDLVAGKSYQVVATSSVQNIDGQGVREGVMDRIEFVAVRFAPEQNNEVLGTEEEIGETPPPVSGEDSVVVADATNMKIDTSLLKSEALVILSWNIAPQSDMSDQVLYTRRGLEDWDSGYSLGKDLSELELEVDMDQNYEILLTTVDGQGNESAGVTLSFSTSLSATGPGTIGTVVALMMIFVIGLLFFRKKHAY